MLGKKWGGGAKAPQPPVSAGPVQCKVYTHHTQSNMQHIIRTLKQCCVLNLKFFIPEYLYFKTSFYRTPIL